MPKGAETKTDTVFWTELLYVLPAARDLCSMYFANKTRSTFLRNVINWELFIEHCSKAEYRDGKWVWPWNFD